MWGKIKKPKDVLLFGYLPRNVFKVKHKEINLLNMHVSCMQRITGFSQKSSQILFTKKSFLFNSPVSWVLLDELALRVYFIHEITLVVIVLNFWLLIHLKILNNYFNFKLLNELLKIILYYSLSHINYIHSQWCERLTNN
jgi:hypothetical protein